jgi:BlaI family transcriptional regulator, penicillinase repressor
MNNTQWKRPKGLGEVEQMVMDYVWAHSPCTAESCRAALAATRPMKDSTVRTILRRLEQKGFVNHELDGRTFVYRPAENRQNVAVRAVKSIIDRFCGGSAEELVVGLVNSDVIDRQQLERLARKVAEGKIGEKSGAARSSRPAKKGEPA